MLAVGITNGGPFSQFGLAHRAKTKGFRAIHLCFQATLAVGGVRAFIEKMKSACRAEK